MRDKPQKSLALLDTIKAVLWSFFGVRHSREHAADMRKLNPMYVIAAGIIAAIIFVLGLILIVNVVVNSK